MSDFKREAKEQFWVYVRAHIGVWCAWDFATTRTSLEKKLAKARTEEPDRTFIAVKETTTFEPLDL